MNRAEKSEVVEKLAERLSRSRDLYLTDFTKVAVKPMTEFRRKLRSAGVEYVVVKNTLALRALKAASVSGIETLTGPTGFVFFGDDPVNAAKAITEFQKEQEGFTIKAGLVGGKPLTAADVKRLASLPPRERMLAELAGLMEAPFQSLVGALDGLLYQMIGVLDALRAQRASAEPQV